MRSINYKIYNPGGNTTALVLDSNFNATQKAIINDEIMKTNPEVEQVGFLSRKSRKLEMAGGEYCGNASRCAAYYYLGGEQGDIELNVSGTSEVIKAGVNETNEAWAQIPHQYRQKACN